MKINTPRLLGSLALPIIMGGVSAFFTFDAINNWYMFLNKPLLNPPNWVFGPVWTFLYLLMGLSLYLFWQSKNTNAYKNGENKKAGFTFFGLQLSVNFLWSILFFALHSPLAAMIDIGVLIVLIVINICYFYPVKRASAFLLIPYLAWVMFATYLNISIFLLN